jgi:hypothetical protein
MSKHVTHFFLMLIALLPACVSNPRSSPMTDLSQSKTSAAVLEVAVYAVRDPNRFGDVQRTAHKQFASFAGFQASVRLRSSANPAVFADLVAWQSLEAASEAAASAQKDPRFAPLFSAIDEMRLFAHYEIGTDQAHTIKALADAPLVEVAAYAVADVGVRAELHPQLHERLKNRPGFRGGRPGIQREDARQTLDLVGWESAAAHKQADVDLQAMPELSKFFSILGDVKVFELFAPQL